MNVGIFWVRAIKCMCAQTRPQLILSSERVFWGMELEPMATPREKSPPLENFPRGGSNPRRRGQRAQTLPTSYSGPWHHDRHRWLTHQGLVWLGVHIQSGQKDYTQTVVHGTYWASILNKAADAVTHMIQRLASKSDTQITHAIILTDSTILL